MPLPSHVTLVLALLVCLTNLPAFAQSATPAPAAQIAPPLQPATGPGGAGVAYDGVLAQHFGPQPDGSAESIGYWLFEPTRPRDGTNTEPLPLVLFLHGFDLVDPEAYHVWIEHLVRRGAIVIYPDFQPEGLPFNPPTLTALFASAPAAIEAAVRDALTQLAEPGHAQADLGKLAVVGHSLGATLGADFAGRAAPGLPQPAALFLVMPGCPPTCDLQNLAQVPATTRMLMLIGDADDVAGMPPATRIWAALSQIPADNKDVILLQSDSHGAPPLPADHFVPLTTPMAPPAPPVGGLNSDDWYGTWKWQDALMSCSFAGVDCEAALGDTPQQRFMGLWSDGQPVTEPRVTDDPATLAPSVATPAT
ncbi:MAG: alpha/beta hydrolase fold domain-containing protein [Thermomicrobiales bacterium]